MEVQGRINALLRVLVAGAFLLIVNAELEAQEVDAELSGLYARWCREYGKDCANSGNAVDDSRFRIFKENVAYIDAHNEGNHSYWLGLNQFSDLTNEEFRQRFLGLRTDLPDFSVLRLVSEDDENENDVLPEQVDWRKKGAVTAPKDQGSCGGCWAFSTTGAIEGINQIVTGKLISLSEQELLDCDTVADHGCNGGLMQNAFDFVVKNGGLDTETDYPYRAAQSLCDKNKMNSRVVAIDGYVSIREGDEKAILRAVAKQPVSVAIEGAGRDFQHYAGGVFTGPCGEEVNHGVLIVGYGTEKGHDYWIVKNSWGSTWGDAGFIKMKRNTGHPGGLCSINTLASYPRKSGPNPPSPSPKPPSPTPKPPSPCPKPPSPTPKPPSPDPEEQCDKLHKCPGGSTCCCKFQVGPMCFVWGCCMSKSAVCCQDHQHCCPEDYPVCSPKDGLCLKGYGDTVGVKISKSTPALLSKPTI